MLAVMILNEQNRETLVIDLLNKGHTARQIAKQAHISFTDITKIKRKATGEVIIEDDNSCKKSLSIQSRAFKMFLEGRTLVDVAIELDSSTQEVMDIFRDYLILKNMYKVSLILKDYKKDLGLFLKWFDCINKYKINSKDLSLAIRYVSDRNFQLKQKGDLEKEIESLIDERDYLLENIKDIKYP